MAGGPTPTFASPPGGTFANVGVKGPLANEFVSSGALDLTLAGLALGGVANVKSAPLARRGAGAASIESNHSL